MKNIEQLNKDHKELLDNLVDDIYLSVSGVMEDLCHNGDIDVSNNEEYERIEKELNMKSIDYVIKKLQSLQKDWQE